MITPTDLLKIRDFASALICLHSAVIYFHYFHLSRNRRKEDKVYDHVSSTEFRKEPEYKDSWWIFWKCAKFKYLGKTV